MTKPAGANAPVIPDEISSNEKLKDDAVTYIEKEFNEIILKNNYASLFDFINLKDFVRSITLDSN